MRGAPQAAGATRETPHGIIATRLRHCRGTPTVANTGLIQAFALAGNDRVVLNEANGALPKAHLSGSTGGDTLVGGDGVDVLDGGLGSNVIIA